MVAVPGVNRAVPMLVECGWQVVEHDIYCASQSGLMDPTQLLPTLGCCRAQPPGTTRNGAVDATPSCGTGLAVHMSSSELNHRMCSAMWVNSAASP